MGNEDALKAEFFCVPCPDEPAMMRIVHGKDMSGTVSIQIFSFSSGHSDLFKTCAERMTTIIRMIVLVVIPPNVFIFPVLL